MIDRGLIIMYKTYIRFVYGIDEMQRKKGKTNVKAGEDGGQATAFNELHRVRTYSASDRDVAMLEAVARYHGLNKSATIASLVRKEFWRVFPAGTETIKTDRGAKVEET
jgi:hypothetical protein